ncbi:ATP-binding cassette domain-containing protein [Actinocorallia sp. API 0066]|uniref:ABC transporter ATP-binding protein n=1 Tax=Actinocorallia sp. API 0066 TaxID=2896846 RepID=UPI001E4686E7|nr:ATP-binding cassette domain-containing protein [Actinocorallia sp. API 0066]MCD0448581.1 ATP-binding cassette domain-containing protein [Actinocorallia sp. API 0066]
MRILSRFHRKKTRAARPAPDNLPELPELSEHRWTAHTAELAETGLLRVARRLPALIGQALALAWRASPRDTAATIGLNVLAGLFTAFGLLATTGVLTALFSAAPTPERVREALPSLVLVAAAFALQGALQAGAGWAQARLEPQIDLIVEMRLYRLSTAVDLAALDDPDFLDDLKRAETRGMIAAPSMVRHTIDLITGLVGLAAAAGALGVLHPALLPLLLLTALPLAWASVRAARMRYITILTLVASRRRRGILSDLMTNRTQAAEVRSFTVRDVLLRQYDDLATHEREVELDLARRQSATRVVGDALQGLAGTLVYVALGFLLWRGAVPLPVAGAAVLAIRTGRTSLANLVYAVNRCYEEGLYFADYLRFCTRAAERVPVRAAQPLPAPSRFGLIRAEEVTFTYPGADEPSLRGVTVELRRGEIVALVGENGSGKTTLAKILAGLYAPESGRVLWDEVPLARVDSELLRERIAVVAQDHTHWPMTARQNVTMGRPDVAEAVDAAVVASGADEVISALARGYDTLLDRRFDGGAELSGGQWQRLAAARGFYRDEPLLICDEPSAALDARAEHALFERIREHARGRTVLLITHRLASVRMADRVYVLEKGRIVEQGDHLSLLAEGGLYADLYGLQASAYHASAPP